VAVVAVVLYHAAVPGIGGGFVGVDVFFVISGFLITGLLWREVNSTGSVRLRRFYGARARRLLPASATVGVITMVAAVLLMPPLQIASVLKDGIASALYVGNYWFLLRGTDYFASHLPPSPFQHFWSLGVEEQFYIVWAPIILATAWIVGKLRRRRASKAAHSLRPYVLVLTLIVAVSFAQSLVETYVAPYQAFYSLQTRAWQLGLGGLVALTAEHWRRLPPRAAAICGWIGLAMILVSCSWLSSIMFYPGFAALLPTVGAVLVIGGGCATPLDGCGRLLMLPPMQAMGRMSYSWYLWHWPVLIFAPLLLGHPLGLAARLTAALLSAGLAWLTLRFVEDPLRFSPKIRDSPGRSLALGTVATVCAVGVGLALLRVVPTPVGPGEHAAPLNLTAQRVAAGSGLDAYDAAVNEAFAQVQAGVAASANLKAVPSNLDPALADAAAEQTAMEARGCMRAITEGGQPECASGDVSSLTTVALVGDSHAAMWRPSFEQMATQRGWRLELLSKGACPLIDVPSPNPLRDLVEDTVHCEQWRSEVLARLRAERPSLIVISMSRNYGIRADRALGIASYDAAWLDSLTRLMQQLRDIGAQVLVLGPVPSPHVVVPICLSAHLDDVAACTPSRSAAVNERGIATESSATLAGGGRYVDLTQLFCTKDSCPVIVGNTLVYFDDNHLTVEHSRQLAPAMGALADRALADS
jgi:peptidoglycan/LPS O-acetylase OafA/YrhL